MPSKSLILLAGSILGGIVLLAFITWLLRRKTASRTDAQEAAPPEETASSTLSRVELIKTEVEPPVVSLRPSATTSGAPSLEELAMKIPASDLRDCLQEIAGRIREEGPNFGEETSMGFIEEMVDRVDDLASMIKNQDEPTAVDLLLFREAIVSILSACGAELIHSAHWDASCQRAITKEVTPGLNAPTILRYGSSGIRRLSQLVRKQEVVLAVPESN